MGGLPSGRERDAPMTTCVGWLLFVGLMDFCLYVVVAVSMIAVLLSSEYHESQS